MALMSCEDAPVQAYNLGNPGEFTVREVAQHIIETLGSKSEVTYLDLPVDDPRQRCPDISRAKADLNWAPKVSLADGLRMTVPYFAGQLQRPAARLLVAE